MTTFGWLNMIVYCCPDSAASICGMDFGMRFKTAVPQKLPELAVKHIITRPTIIASDIGYSLNSSFNDL